MFEGLKPRVSESPYVVSIEFDAGTDTDNHHNRAGQWAYGHDVYDELFIIVSETKCCEEWKMKASMPQHNTEKILSIDVFMRFTKAWMKGNPPTRMDDEERPC